MNTEGSITLVKYPVLHESIFDIIGFASFLYDKTFFIYLMLLTISQRNCYTNLLFFPSFYKEIDISFEGRGRNENLGRKLKPYFFVSIQYAPYMEIQEEFFYTCCDFLCM